MVSADVVTCQPRSFRTTTAGRFGRGSTKNATRVIELLVDLRERGLDVTKPILTVINGAEALRHDVVDVFDHPVIAWCQLH